MKKLTLRQKEVLNFIQQEIAKKNYPPSIREICKALDLKSSSTVHAHLAALQRKGFIKRDPSKPRAISLTEPSAEPSITKKLWQNVKPVPLVGQVTAGTPILANENIESYMLLPFHIVKNDIVFLLRVLGDSMINAGIYPEDLVIVRQQSTAENGEIVVALLENEATIKRIYREKDHIRLQPENHNYKPIKIYGEISILGKVIGLFRTVV